jgi:hypothetical protein
MGPAGPITKLRSTVAQYLAMERASPERHCYLDGEIRSAAGESPAHADISVNLVALLGNKVRGTLCRVRTKATKVCSGPLLSAG